jgi:hypothetical protein
MRALFPDTDSDVGGVVVGEAEVAGFVATAFRLR